MDDSTQALKAEIAGGWLPRQSDANCFR